MSIPPLVCSTPPPPEQCEDEKDHEDFDLAYRLSQEDDDDSTEYNYGNFSGYNTYPSKIEQIEKDNWQSNFNIETEAITKPDDINNDSFISNDNLFNENTQKIEENVLEDLNLEVSSDNIHSNDMAKDYETDDIYNSESTDKNTMIQDQGGTDVIENIEEPISASASFKALDSLIPNDSTTINFDNDETDRNEDSPIPEEIEDDKICNDNEQVPSNFSSIDPESTEVEIKIANDNQINNKSLSDDDFGDFEDFQFTATSVSQVESIKSENPWDNDNSESADFGDFKANFDTNNIKETLDDAPIKVSKSEVETCPSNVRDDDEDDDFGDFDDFKSSTIHSEDKECTNEDNSLQPNVPMFSLHSTENELQIVDSINNVLKSIFVEEITEPENDLDGKLEQYLSETWGHLVDIDVRQPYIVNWNNSLGQKTLLKALCIDSRNILFGPKWNYNMPKYATNLSTAPLQPQKQLAQSNVVADSAEKAPSKETASWVDPFTPDGQESCNTENDSTKSETIKRPTDLGVFGSETTSKMNNIYSSTINVQPLRHINLPDTHIFTPTDSETPRSKTIHYDSGLPQAAIVPQPAAETVKQPEQEIAQPAANNTEDEYWEFQDFKGSTTDVPVNNEKEVVNESTKSKSSSECTTTKPGVTYETQILQPIKIEPIIPTLNWPDPGEVKETFADFSDFISSQSWSNEKGNSSEPKEQIMTNSNENKEALVPNSENVEDDFETFQSAPISSTAVNDKTILTPQNNVPSSLTQNMNMNVEATPFKKEDNTILNTVPIGSNNLLLNNPTPASNLPNLQDTVFIKPPTSNLTNHINTDILQPSNLNPNVSQPLTPSNRNHHTAGQILQPLSLESYSQINWPNPGIDLQDLSRFNPINSLNSLKSDNSAGNSKIGSPMHPANTVQNEAADDDIWGDFVSSAPKTQQTSPKKNITAVDDEEWTDFVSSPTIKPQNGLNTISLNVHTNSSMHKGQNQNKFASGSNQIQLDIPALNYITPKSNSRGVYMEKHFQNL